MPPKASGRGRKKVVQEKTVKAVEKNIETYFSPSKKLPEQTFEIEKGTSDKLVAKDNEKNEEIVKPVTKQGRKRGKLETIENDKILNGKVEEEDDKKNEDIAEENSSEKIVTKDNEKNEEIVQVKKQGRKRGKLETIENDKISNGKVEAEDDKKNEDIVEPAAKQGRKKGKLTAASNISDKVDTVVSNSLPTDNVASVPQKRGRKKLQKEDSELTESNLKDNNIEQNIVKEDDRTTLKTETPAESIKEIEDKNETNGVKTKGIEKRGRKKITDETVVTQSGETVLSKPNSKATKSGAIKVESDKSSEKETKENKVEEEEVNNVPVKVGGKRKNANAVSQKRETKRNKTAEKKVSNKDTVDKNKILKVSLKRSKSIDELASEEKDKVTEKGKDAKKSTARGKRGKAADTGNDVIPAKKLKEETKSKGQSKKDKMPDVTVLDFSNTSTSPTGKAWNLKLASWNVNGVRAWLEKDGLVYLKHESPDIMCIQETKCSEDKLPSEVKVEGYHSYWLAGDKDGYSGVGLLSKKEPLSVKYGIDIKEHDIEGRVITAEYEDFFLISAYVPNAGRGLVRLDYRMQWDKDFCSYIKSLDESKPVILCGDLNVAHEEIDLANPKTNKKNAGFTKEEREGFSTLLSEGFIDTFRHLYPDQKAAYTFWTYMMNARAKNVGWRLDYFVVSKRFVDKLCDSVIRKDVFGSDHCPIVLFISV